MSPKIDGLDSKPVRVSAAAPVRKVSEAATGKAGSGGAREADVQITSAARSLASLEQALLDLPAIDQARVEEVQQRLASGRYEVDPQRVADGLLRSDGDLARLARK